MRDLNNLTNLPKSILRDLKQSRLWVLAVALGVALIAIPLVLAKPAKEGGATSVAPVTTALGTGYTLPELKPVVDVTATGVSGRDERKAVRRLTRKNPFEPLVKPKAKSSSGGDGGGAAAGESGASAGSGSSGTSGSAGTPAPTTQGGSEGTSGSTGSGTGVTYFTYVAKVKFGELGKTKDKTVQQLRALPSSDDPLVVFMGATLDGETAIFLVSNNADLQGDGTCKPSQDDCVFLYMQPGDDETFEVAGADGSLVTYELQLDSIESKVLDEAPSAKSSSKRKRGSKTRASHEARTSKRASWYNALGRVRF